jgi:hypothetical protein
MFKKTALLGAMLSLFSANAMAISVTATDDANVLANEILGSGITISNATYIGTTTQSGTFTDDSVFGIGSGIVLTTGDVATAADEVNTDDGQEYILGTAGDTDLSTLVGATTNDAAVLEFDFTTAGGDLFFNWAFASEEYNEWVDSAFNDVFAFFVNGINIALAPDGQVAAINSINCGGDGLTLTGDNCSSYNNNDLQNGGGSIATEYDGFTSVLTATNVGLLDLGAGTHHIKIAIADTSDAAWDSAVFIQAGSFSDTPPNGSVPEPGILALLGLGLAGMTIARRRKLT